MDPGGEYQLNAMAKILLWPSNPTMSSFFGIKGQSR